MYNQAGVDALDAVRAVVASFGAPLLFRKLYGILNAMEMHVEETPYSVEVLQHLGKALALQRHLIALLKFVPVESRFCSCKRRGKATFDTPINPCARSACSRSVAVGLEATARLYQVDEPQSTQLARALATFLRTAAKQ
jgi:hypothetical protein